MPLIDLIYLIIVLSVGVVIGVIATWTVCQAKAAQRLAEAESQSHASSITVTERLAFKEKEAQSLRTELDDLALETDKLRVALSREIEARSAAAEKASRVPQLEREIDEKETARSALLEQLSDLRSRNKELETLLEEQRKASQERFLLLQEETQQARDKLSDAFKALSADALKSNNQAFLDLARTTLERFQFEARGDLEQRQRAVERLVAPIRETLEKYDQQIQAIEKSRSEAYGSLHQQVQSLLVSQQKLQAETGNLVKALRTPQVRGRWGELTLRRVVELAGMTEHCDFDEQTSVTGESGKLRPDMIVYLPAGKTIVVDSKVPLQAYLDALEAPDDESRQGHLKSHARQMRAHLQNLSSKAYWDQFQSSPEFVVLFIPGESFYGAAVEEDPQLFEEGVNLRVILATPATLIAVLRAVAYGWRQEKIAEGAQAISDLGKSLYDRLTSLTRHFEELGRNLDRSVDAYNRALGSLESRVLVAARRFKELGATAQDEISELSPIERRPREIQSPELITLPSCEEEKQR